LSQRDDQPGVSSRVIATIDRGTQPSLGPGKRFDRQQQI
jgi:hypothetical protein